MGRGYSIAGTAGRLNQGKAEQSARNARNDPKRAEREAVTRAEGKAEAERRNALLKNFAPRDKVTDGRYVAYVMRLDTLRGQLVVALVPSGKETWWSPDFINKIP